MAIEDYFSSEAQSAFIRYTNFEKLVPNQTLLKGGGKKSGSNHPGEDGRFVENIVKVLLNKYLPQNLRALTVFIIRPKAVVGGKDNLRLIEQEDNIMSSQIDILVYDVNNYPVYEKFDDFVIVPPEGVIAIIQIKKTFYPKQFNEEIDKLIFNTSLCRHYIELKHSTKSSTPPKVKVVAPVSVFLCFTASWANKDNENRKEIEIAIKNYKRYYTRKNYDAVINLFSIIDRFSLVKGRKEKYEAPIIPFLHYSDTKLEEIVPKSEIQFHIGLQHLLWMILKNYYHRTRQPHIVMPGFTYLGKEGFEKLEAKNIPVIGSRILEQEYPIQSTLKKTKDLLMVKHGEVLKAKRKKEKEKKNRKN